MAAPSVGRFFYIESAFQRIGLKTLGKGAAIFFAVMTMGASVSVFQVNQSYEQFSNVTGVVAPLIFGVLMATMVAVVILGGIKRIGKVTGILVPAMGGLYLLAGLVIIAINIVDIPAAIALIFKSAFGLEAAGGGFVGALINGMRRATYSNEAGVGSSAIAHSAVKTNEPLTEGYVALLEPFIDTIVVCTITALVVIVTGAYEPYLLNDSVAGIQITSEAFASAFSWFPYILLVASMLFAFTTLVFLGVLWQSGRRLSFRSDPAHRCHLQAAIVFYAVDRGGDFAFVNHRLYRLDAVRHVHPEHHCALHSFARIETRR